MYYKFEKYSELDKIYLSGDFVISKDGVLTCSFICQFNIKTEEFVKIGTPATSPLLPSLDIDYGENYLYYSGSIINSTYIIKRISKPSTFTAWENINPPFVYPFPSKVNSIYACDFLDCLGSYAIGGSNGILHYYSAQAGSWYSFGNGTNGEVLEIQLYSNSYQFGLSMMITLIFIVYL